MDIATFAGIFSAFALVLSAIMMGGGLGLFVNVPSLMIVAGGTLGATLINYPLKEVFKVVKVVRNAFFAKQFSPAEAIANFVTLAGQARREGILALEPAIKDMDDEFARTGLQLAMDGMEPESIQAILETELEYIQERHKLGAEIFTTMGTFAPALGMIGTLIGLVQMLQTMDDPSTIGPAMAVALLTTFYGAIMANIIFNPIAGKLRTRSTEEVLAKELTIEGVMCIAKGENPRILEQRLKAFIAPKQREQASS
ncbi:MAG: MotA/TolQ/ExbB proton channel family protein [Deltaproteobacteria bacterium]|nr:MotA/TolQ/ExbB proton channel family protein [Deltaproteobacteria bacterium]MBW2069725.1 MotA/TolQ/ExbB proton channel family protein [Deltaproteobacteria bacterium]